MFKTTILLKNVPLKEIKEIYKKNKTTIYDYKKTLILEMETELPQTNLFSEIKERFNKAKIKILYNDGEICGFINSRGEVFQTRTYNVRSYKLDKDFLAFMYDYFLNLEDCLEPDEVSEIEKIEELIKVKMNEQGSKRIKIV